jgi:hypothetical protein
MKLTSPLLVLGIALAPAVSEGNSRVPLANRDGRPAVGNIGQRGRIAEARPAARAVPHPVLHAIRAAQTRAHAQAKADAELRARAEAPVEIRMKPLVTEEQRPAVGNAMGKKSPRRRR